MTIDFATILWDAIDDARGGEQAIHDAPLAAKVSDLCPDCNEHGYLRTCPVDTDGDGNCAGCARGRFPHICDHPNAPTVAKLLAIGAAVWEADGNLSRFADPELFDPSVRDGINSMLAYIITINDPSKAVEP
jgi:hypothetical protein